jgi:hypothetical protein
MAPLGKVSCSIYSNQRSSTSSAASDRQGQLVLGYVLTLTNTGWHSAADASAARQFLVGVDAVR